MEDDQPKELAIEDFKFESVSKFDLKFKIAIVGDQKVGKTSLIKRQKVNWNLLMNINQQKELIFLI